MRSRTPTCTCRSRAEVGRAVLPAVTAMSPALGELRPAELAGAVDLIRVLRMNVVEVQRPPLTCNRQRARAPQPRLRALVHRVLLGTRATPARVCGRGRACWSRCPSAAPEVNACPATNWSSPSIWSHGEASRRVACRCGVERPPVEDHSREAAPGSASSGLTGCSLRSVPVVSAKGSRVLGRRPCVDGVAMLRPTNWSPLAVRTGRRLHRNRDTRAPHSGVEDERVASDF